MEDISMINNVWLFLILSSIGVAAATGKISLVSDTVFSNTAQALEFTIGLAGTIAFWSGMLKVAEAAGITRWVAKLFRPALKWLFPSFGNDSGLLGSIALTLSANLLGLGNVATPLGLETMNRLQRTNPRKEGVSREICTFLALVLGGLTIMPSTLIGIRARAGSVEPALIVVPVFLVTLFGTAVGLTVNYLADRVTRRQQRKE
jgi:spore maturation protein A